MDMIRRLKNEFIWFGPFVLLCLMAVTLFRPWATVPPIATGRVIFDEEGKEFVLPEPFLGVIVDGYGLGEFIRSTHAPGVILKIAGQKGPPRRRSSLEAAGMPPERIYPQLASNAALWDFPPDTESVLAKDAGGVYLMGGAYFKEFGLTMLEDYSHGDEPDRNIVIPRMLNNLLGRKEYAETLIARYRYELASLVAELRLDAIAEAERPRVLGMVDAGWERVFGESSWFDARLGFRDPTTGYLALGRESDAERILAMPADIIILAVGAPDEFVRDPRWRGMEAVQNRRVYAHTAMSRHPYDLDYLPLGIRWLAEVAYPDRMQPKMRDLIRSHFEESYGGSVSRLSEDELDEMLYVSSSRNMERYVRFMRTDAVKESR
jgi:hypothetical protein